MFVTSNSGCEECFKSLWVTLAMGAPGLGSHNEAVILSCDNAAAAALAKSKSIAVTIPSLPTFFVVGPPRTGTTWLHHVLQHHVNLPMPTKETRFFDRHFHRGLKWYGNHFPAIQYERPTGEIAPTYFASPEACERIASTIPSAKIIFIFRDPVQRVVSHYRVKRAYGLVPWSFEQALERDPELLDSGRYATCLQRWQAAFPQDQLLVTLYEDLRDAPQAYMDRLFAFLGMPAGKEMPKLKHIHGSERMTQPRNYILTRTATALADWCKGRNLDRLVAAVRESQLIRLFLGGGAPFPEISSATRQAIAKVFRPEVEQLQRLIARDLSVWKLSQQ